MINNMNHMINMHMINNEHNPHADGRAVFLTQRAPRAKWWGGRGSVRAVSGARFPFRFYLAQ